MSFCIICHQTDNNPEIKCSKGHTVHENCFMEWIVYKKLFEKKCLICGEKIGTIWGEIISGIFLLGTILFPVWFYMEYLDEE